MELDQLLKQVDWLDEERRKNQATITILENRLTALEGNFPPLLQHIKELNGEISRLSSVLARMDRFDEALLQARQESKQGLDEISKTARKREEESEKIRRVEMRGLDASLLDLRKELVPIPELKRSLQGRIEEDSRLAKAIDEIKSRMDTVRRSEEEYIRSLRLLEDGRRQDAKRLTDLQGEVTALRKQADEQRGRADLSITSIKKIETRLSEISLLETERQEATQKFLDSQSLLQVERDRIWKDWDIRFVVIEQQTADVESNLQTLDATHRAVKRSQQTLDELSQKVDRRINEMVEIQRLAEERFRQDWVTFRADDQKRWTNYTLTQEEQRGENQRTFERLTDRLAQVEETIDEIQDLLAQVNEQSEKRLQGLLAVVHEWVTSYERSIGRTR